MLGGEHCCGCHVFRFGLGFVRQNQDFQDYGDFQDWIPAYAGMTVWWDCLVFTLAFDSSPIKGEGDSVGWFVLLLPCPVDTALKPV